MPGRTDVQTIAGALLYISATLPPTYDAAGYDSTDVVYTEIGDVENFGNHGGTATVNEFTPIATAVKAKSKGTKDYGTMSLMIGSIPSAAGQIILAAAFESNAHYSAKLVYPDGEKHFMDVLISKHEYQDGSVNDFSRIAVDLAICKKPVIVAAV